MKTKFSLDEDIIFQIEMMSYNEYNYQIASAYDNVGDIYSLKDIEDMQGAQEHYEKKLAYEAIKELQSNSVNAMNKLGLLLNDLKINKEKEQKDGKSYFNTDLFSLRVREIYKILKGE